jgi:hypothetical protein
MEDSTTQFFGDIAVSSKKGIGAVYSFVNTVEKQNENTISTVKVEVKDKTGTIASWGKNNKYPQEIVEAITQSGSGSSGLRFLRKSHYGNGLILFENTPDENGKKAIKLLDVSTFTDIDVFFKKSQIKKYLKETIADLEWFSICYPEYILSDNYASINRVKRQKSAWCRFEVMNSETGLIENVYISQKFGRETVNTDSEFISVVPHIDPYWSVEEVKEYCQKNKIKKFIRPAFYPLIDEGYYPSAEWHAIVKNGWLEVANSVPALKKAMFKNQITIKYQIEIDERYFETKYYPIWKDKTVEDRIKIREDLIDAINESLTGNDNAAKSIQSMMFVDDKGVQTSAIKITAIDDKLKDGSYLPEAEAANSEVLFALGVDPSLIGAGIPGGKLGAGSGSDKNAAFNILQALKKTDREVTLETLEFVRDYNNWDTKINFGFEDTVLTTLDKNPTGTQTATA